MTRPRGSSEGDRRTAGTPAARIDRALVAPPRPAANQIATVHYSNMVVNCNVRPLANPNRP